MAAVIKCSVVEVEEETCFSTNIWKAYESYFTMAESVTITSLITNMEKDIILDFTNNLIAYISSNFHSYLIINNIQVNETIAINLTKTVRFRAPNLVYQKSTEKHINYTMSFSFIAKYLYLTIAWNENAMEQFLNGKSHYCVGKKRALHLIFFITLENVSCTKHSTIIDDVLIRYWDEFNVLNVVAQAPCLCESIYIYRPFDRIAAMKSWGVVYVYNSVDVIEYPHLLLNNLTNLHKFPLEVALFERKLTSQKNPPRIIFNNPIYQYTNDNFYGVDASVLKNLAEKLNCSLKIVKAWEEYYGEVMENGTISGSLGLIANNQAQLAANGYYIKYYGTNDVEFTVPYSNDETCVIVPKSQRIPQWMVLFICFKWTVWLGIFITILTITIFWYILKRYELKTSLNKAWLESWAIFLSVPQNISITYTGLRIFLAICMIFNMIIVNLFQGSLFKSYTTISYYADINTLKELDDANILIKTSLRIFDKNQSELFKRLAMKTSVNLQLSMSSMDLAAHSQSVACVERKTDAKVFLKTKYLNDDGLPLLHIVSECPVSYFMAYIVPKGSPFLPIFNRIISRFLESGLIEKWYNDIVDSMIMEMQFKHPKNIEILKPFKLHDVQTGFLILVFGLFVALIVFSVEFYLGK